MKRMLFNATHQEELRVAIVDGQKLIDLDIETAGREQRKGNIYKGVITRIEPGLEACFVNYGEERHGFLPFKEVARSYFKDGVEVRSARIQDALTEGQEIIVQVEKEERGNKGAALTTFISLAGRHLVLMPNNPRGGGVSRRVEGEERQELRDAMDQLNIPQGMSVIARTAGIGRSVEELQWDLSYLQQLWDAIDTAARDNAAPVLIYLESSLVIRAIRDYFSPDIGEILIDTDDIADQATAFMSVVMPDNVNRVKRYRDDIPLFSRFQIEHQIETAYARTVELPSGGAVVIDHTEALVAVDVNSARSTRGADIEETALRTNLEAADEVARQLRLRDLGGLIVIDFIDMEDSKNQRAVEQRLRDALRFDRARVQMGKISRFGLMELSRQRLRPALNEGSHITCPRCNGTGVIRDAESSALHILRLIQEEAMKDNTAAVHAQVPVDVATFLLNEKRGDIAKLEARLKVNVILIPNKNLETPHHSLERLRHDDPRLEETKPSFTLAEAAAEVSVWKAREENTKPRQEALVKGVTPETPAPLHTPRPAAAAAGTSDSAAGGIAGLFKRIAAWFGGSTAESKPAAQPASAKPAGARPEGASSRRQSDSRQQNGERQRNNRRNGNERRAPETTEAGSTAASQQQERRQPRTPRNADARDAVRQHQVATRHQDAQAPVPAAAEGEDGSPRNSRNRRSRSRGGRREDLALNGDVQTTDTNASVLPVATAGIAANATAEAGIPQAAPVAAAQSLDQVDDSQDLDALRQDGADDNGEADPERKRRRRRSRRGRRQTGDENGTQLDGENSNEDGSSVQAAADDETSAATPVAAVAAIAATVQSAEASEAQAVAPAITPAAEAPATTLADDASPAAEAAAPAAVSTTPAQAQEAVQAAQEPAAAEALASLAEPQEAAAQPVQADATVAPEQASATQETLAAAVETAETSATATTAEGSISASDDAAVVVEITAAQPAEQQAADAVATTNAAQAAQPEQAEPAVQVEQAPVQAVQAENTAAAVATPAAQTVEMAEAAQAEQAAQTAEPVASTVSNIETVVEQAIQVRAAAGSHGSANGQAQPLESVIAAAGLQWVETRHDAVTPAASAAPPVKLGRPRKTAAAAPAPVALQQVETADADAPHAG